MVYGLLMKIKTTSNSSEVAGILQEVFGSSILNEEIAKENLRTLERVRDLGEDEVYARAIDRLRHNPIYSKLIQ